MDPTSVSPELQPKWYVVDAEGKTLGRLSTSIAMHLMGKHRPHYAPHQFFGDHVVVVNAGKIKVTGRKLDQKIYYWHTSYPGGLKELPLRKALAEHPVKVIQWAVEGMLPKNRIGKRMIRCLKLYAGPEHPHVAQRPEPLQSPAARKSA
ncbi:MAG: 50S ribosomal protein L13 [Acidobacteria bacterium]|nr:50S ribosomal protein L13 [Acidobacteriota bacterium]